MSIFRNYMLRSAKIALFLGLLAAFTFSYSLFGSRPKPNCGGSSCSGACSTSGGNCCAAVGDDDTCMCLSVNSGC